MGNARLARNCAYRNGFGSVCIKKCKPACEQRRSKIPVMIGFPALRSHIDNVHFD